MPSVQSVGGAPGIDAAGLTDLFKTGMLLHQQGLDNQANAQGSEFDKQADRQNRLDVENLKNQGYETIMGLKNQTSDKKDWLTGWQNAQKIWQAAQAANPNLSEADRGKFFSDYMKPYGDPPAGLKDIFATSSGSSSGPAAATQAQRQTAFGALAKGLSGPLGTAMGMSALGGFAGSKMGSGISTGAMKLLAGMLPGNSIMGSVPGANGIPGDNMINPGLRGAAMDAIPALAQSMPRMLGVAGMGGTAAQLPFNALAGLYNQNTAQNNAYQGIPGARPQPSPASNDIMSLLMHAASQLPQSPLGNAAQIGSDNMYGQNGNTGV